MKFVFQSVKLESGIRILVVMCFQCKTEIASTVILNMPFCPVCAKKNSVDLSPLFVDDSFPSAKVGLDSVWGYPVVKDN